MVTLKQKVQKNPSRGQLIAALAVLLPLCYIGTFEIHDEILASNFARVSVGMQRIEVVGILGTLRYAQACTLPGPFKPWKQPDCAETSSPGKLTHLSCTTAKSRHSNQNYRTRFIGVSKYTIQIYK